MEYIPRYYFVIVDSLLYRDLYKNENLYKDLRQYWELNQSMLAKTLFRMISNFCLVSKNCLDNVSNCIYWVVMISYCCINSC